jgi:hypothetical protein
MTAGARVAQQLDPMHEPGAPSAGGSMAAGDGPPLKRARAEGGPADGAPAAHASHAPPQQAAPGAAPPQPPQEQQAGGQQPGGEQQQQQAQQQAQAGGGADGPGPLHDLPEGEDDDDGGAAGAGRGPRTGPRELRLRQRRWWGLWRRFADLTAQIEAAICEARGWGRRGAWCRLCLLAAGGYEWAAAVWVARPAQPSPSLRARRPQPRPPPTPHPPPQAKALIAWRTLPRAPRPAPLSTQDREVLAVQHNRRLFDCASKACLGVIKTMMVQKVRGPGEGGRGLRGGD